MEGDFCVWVKNERTFDCACTPPRGVFCAEQMNSLQGVSGKVHSEHIVATKVLMPVGGGGGVWLSGKVHSEHIVATKVLMLVCVCVGGGGGFWESAL